MRWISLQFGDPSVVEAKINLPCPVEDLIRLATTVGGSGCRREACQLIRQNPSLMLYSLNEFFRSKGSAPRSVSELLDWSQGNLIAVLSNSVWNVSPDEGARSLDRKQLKPFFSQFLRTRSNKKLRKSLRTFLVNICGARKILSKRIVAQVVGKHIRADKFKVKRIRSLATQKQLVQTWRGSSRSSVDVRRWFALAANQLESSQAFATRLHEEKLASMKQLAYGASHEINNPLANIATRAQTLLAIETDPEKRYKLSVIYEQAIRAHEMISDMMLFAHPPALRTQRVSIRLLMARINRELKPKFDTAPSVQTTIVIGSGVDHVNVDPTQLAVAIKSLVENSLESLSQHASLNLRADHQIEVRVTEWKANELEITVHDTGEPVSADVARHMFDPFFSGREAGRGLGFGLSKAWTIAKLHGGSLQYETSDEPGNRFRLTVPIDSEYFSGEPKSDLSICTTEVMRDMEAA